MIIVTKQTHLLKTWIVKSIGLIPASFSGAAAEGFKAFYTKNIVPANGENLANLLKTIDEIAQGILDAIPGASGLDDQLADGNQQ